MISGTSSCRLRRLWPQLLTIIQVKQQQYHRDQIFPMWHDRVWRLHILLQTQRAPPSDTEFLFVRVLCYGSVFPLQSISECTFLKLHDIKCKLTPKQLCIDTNSLHNIYGSNFPTFSKEFHFNLDIRFFMAFFDFCFVFIWFSFFHVFQIIVKHFIT